MKKKNQALNINEKLLMNLKLLCLRGFNPDGQRVAKEPYFLPIPLRWAGFRLKNEFYKNKGIFSDQFDVIKQRFLFFVHAHKLKFGLFCASISIFLSRSLFFLCLSSYKQFCFPLYRPSFAWNPIYGWLTF